MQQLPYFVDIYIFVFIACMFMFLSVKRVDYISEGFEYIRCSFIVLIFYATDGFLITMTREGIFVYDYDLLYYLYAFYLVIPMISNLLIYKYYSGVIGKFKHPFRMIMHSSFFVNFLAAIVIIAAKDTTFFAYPSTEGAGLTVGVFYYISAAIVMLPYAVMCLASIFFYFVKENFGVREVIVPIIVISGIVLAFGIADCILGAKSSYALVGLSIAEMFLYTHTIVLSVNSDDLTGLYNKRQMLKDVEHFVRNHIPWGMMMIDANNFKKINDEFGHSEGDKAIRVIANILEGIVDRNDSKAYRFGGDEFVIILSREKVDDAESIMMMIEYRLEKINEQEIFPFALSVSYGYETFEEDKVASISDVLAKADEKMYYDKKMKKGIRTE